MHERSNANAGPERLVLLAAGNGPDMNGWLFAITDAAAAEPSVELIDHLNSSGIVIEGDRVYRLLSSPSEADASGDFIVYDTSGVAAYRRVDGLADTHGLAWDGANFVVPCSFTNEIFRLSPSGETLSVWRAPGEGDAWHINGVHVRDGQLFASAFGTSSQHRGWAKGLAAPNGLIFHVETRQPVVRGLTCPHDPIFINNEWLVCDSYTKRVLRVDEATGAVTKQALCDGWTRGLAVNGDHVYVGISGQRYADDSDARAQIVVLDAATFAPLRTIQLPCKELTSLAFVPASLLPGLRRGFRTNNLRVAVQDRRDLLAGSGSEAVVVKQTPMARLDQPGDCRVRILVKSPRNVAVGHEFQVQLSIKNRSTRTMFSAAPFPVNIAIVFTNLDAPDETPDVRREPLPEPLCSGQTLRFTLALRSPARPGRYSVRFTLLQEWVRWFDDDRRWRARLMSTNRRYIKINVGAPDARPRGSEGP